MLKPIHDGETRVETTGAGQPERLTYTYGPITAVVPATSVVMDQHHMARARAVEIRNDANGIRSELIIGHYDPRGHAGRLVAMFDLSNWFKPAPTKYDAWPRLISIQDGHAERTLAIDHFVVPEFAQILLGLHPYSERLREAFPLDMYVPTSEERAGAATARTES